MRPHEIGAPASGKSGQFTTRLLWLMRNGPLGPIRQVDLVTRSAQLGDGLTKAEVNRIIHGGTDPRLSTLEKLARALSVEICELMPQGGTLKDRLHVEEIGNDQVVIDTWSRQPADGKTVVIRHPVQRTLKIMQASIDGEHFRFNDETGYVMGDADLVVGEVVLTVRKRTVSPPTLPEGSPARRASRR